MEEFLKRRPSRAFTEEHLRRDASTFAGDLPMRRMKRRGKHVAPRPPKRGVSPAAAILALALSMTGGAAFASTISEDISTRITDAPIMAEPAAAEKMPTTDSEDDGTVPVTTTNRELEREEPGNSTPSPDQSSATPPAPAAEPIEIDELEVEAVPDDDFDEDDIPTTGSGKFVVAEGSSEATGDDPLRYTVEVEKELPFDVDQAAEFIDETLADERGWVSEGKQFKRVSDDSYDIRILISTPDTVDELCAPLQTQGEVSCGTAYRATLNAMRWALAVPDYDGDVDNYRRYLILHEVGHLLGKRHVDCPGAGELAPTMVQQTYGVGECKPNPWPAPDAK